MNTKVVMTASSISLGVIGIVFTFMPAEILHWVNLEAAKSLTLMVQILGALYFSYAMLNWMSKGNLIGGIYNRPIAVANFTHYLIAALALIKGVTSLSNTPTLLLAMAILYCVFAIAFGLILFRHPLPNKKTE